MGKITQQRLYLSDRVQGQRRRAGCGSNDLGYFYSRGSSLSKRGLQPHHDWSLFVLHIDSWEHPSPVHQILFLQVARWWRRPSSMPPVPRDDSHNTQHSSCGFDDSSQNSQRQSTSTSTPFVSLSLGWIQSPPKQLQGQVVCKKNCLSAFSGEQSLHKLLSNGRLDKRISLTGRSAAGRRQLLHTQSCFPYLPSEAAGCPHRFIHAEC